MKKTILSLAFLWAGLTSFGQHHSQKYVPETDPLVLEKLEQWQDMKFGLLMHWGAYSQWGIVESWSICPEDEGWCARKSPNYEAYKKEYEGLKGTFNPVGFNPKKWAKAAKNAGMKYLVFTTKHHDGFCMYDTKQTDYKITDPGCPYSKNPKADVTKEIFNSFRAEGIWAGAYFSKPDWHSPYYWWPNFATPDRNVNYDVKKYPEQWEKFVKFTHAQVDEIVSNYGKVDILWFDGGWVAPMSEEERVRLINKPDAKHVRFQNQDIRMDEIVANARKKQPGIIVVDRAVEGKNQNYLTPENTVPAATLPFPWESCIIAGGGWSWVNGAKYKSTNELVHMLVDIVCKGGNLLLNIAPGPKGQWQEEAYDRLEGIGDWMNVNSEAIYSSRPVKPYKEGRICLTGSKSGDAVYAIYLAEENEKQMPSKMFMSGWQPEKGMKVTLLGSKTPLSWEAVGTGFVVNIPEKLQKHAPCKNAWTLKFSK